MIETILSTVFIYMYYCCFMINNWGRKPILMRHKIYRRLCRFGRKIKISEDKEHYEDLFRYDFFDPRYNIWRDDILRSGSISANEELSFLYKRVSELAEEITKRKKSILKL